MNSKAGAIQGMLTAFLGIILLVVLLPIMNDFLGTIFQEIDSSPNIAYGSMMIMLLGSIGIILVVGIIYNTLNEIMTPRQPQY